MKKHLSVFGLFARSSVYKVLGTMLAACAAQVALFIMKYSAEPDEIYVDRFESYIEKSHAYLLFCAALILITLLLCLPGTEYRSKVGYTLRRLSISERAVFLHQAAFNIIVYIVFWAVQVTLVFALSIYYNATVPAKFVSNQSVFLAFYRSSFLHSLLPLSDILLWIRNILLFAALGFAAAVFTYNQRRKKFGVTAIALAVYILLFFSRGIGDISNCIITIIISALVIAHSIYTVSQKEDSYDS